MAIKTQQIYQVIKYVFLVDMDSDEGLELCPLHLGQVLCGLVNQDVQQVQESLVRLLHDLPVVAGVGQSLCGVSCPYHLDTQDSNLKQTDQNYFLNLFLEFKQAFNFKTYIRKSRSEFACLNH